jgi:hypothetical protein
MCSSIASIPPAMREQYRMVADDFAHQFDTVGQSSDNLQDTFAAQNLVYKFWTQDQHAALIRPEFAMWQYWRAAVLVNQAMARKDSLRMWRAHFHASLAVYLEYMDALGLEAFWQAFGIAGESLVLKPMHDCLKRIMAHEGLVRFLSHKFPEATGRKDTNTNDSVKEGAMDVDDETESDYDSSDGSGYTFRPIKKE